MGSQDTGAESPGHPLTRRSTTRTRPIPGTSPTRRSSAQENANHPPLLGHLTSVFSRCSSFSPNERLVAAGPGCVPGKFERVVHSGPETLQSEKRWLLRRPPGAEVPAVTGAPGLHFPEFTSTTVLNGSTCDYSEFLDYTSQNAAGKNAYSRGLQSLRCARLYGGLDRRGQPASRCSYGDNKTLQTTLHLRSERKTDKATPLMRKCSTLLFHFQGSLRGSPAVALPF